ncbi:MAG: preprotein translocase subunit SecE [Candidatus Saccharibacteria bacterium]|nr:preprotein translocase subunit SecE [Candidatus Saccharibacteria bacterium]
MPKVTRIKSKDREPEKNKDARVVARVSSGEKSSKKETVTEVSAKKSSENVVKVSGKNVDKKALVKKRRQDKKAAKQKEREKKRLERIEKRKNEPKWKKVLLFLPRLIIMPFAALGRYIHDSWIELRQVRWPSRKMTWKMFFAILVYVMILMVVVMGLDALFTWLFNFIIGK